MENTQNLRNKDLDRTVKVLGILATQRNTGLLSFIVNQNPEVISYLNQIGNKNFANFLGNYVESTPMFKSNSSSREL